MAKKKKRKRMNFWVWFRRLAPESQSQWANEYQEEAYKVTWRVIPLLLLLIGIAILALYAMQTFTSGAQK
jgi:hypothetical protein